MAFDFSLLLASSLDVARQTASATQSPATHWMDQLRELSIVFPERCHADDWCRPDHFNHEAGRPYFSFLLEWAYIRLSFVLVCFVPAWRERIFHLLFVYLGWWLISIAFMSYYDSWKDAQLCKLDDTTINYLSKTTPGAVPKSCQAAEQSQ